MAAVATFQIPSQLKQFDLSFPCTKEQANDVIGELARQVSHVYARLLTLKGHQERGTEFFFLVESSPFPKTFPSVEQVENFEKQLAEAVVHEFKNSYAGSVNLSVHYAPEGILDDVMLKCGINGHVFDLTRYFPCKMHTDIFFRRDQQIIQVKQWEGRS